ncbi:MAG TPA: SRPBCC family protein [Polyangiaceae bacterium]|nr:SRPBCC family protein [Polyangiaceae bacterium]
MSLVAQSEITVAGPVAAVFERFIHFPGWKDWMPRSFRPVRGPSRPLKEGDRIVVSIAGLPSRLHVEKVDRAREVCWSGGLGPIVHARHSFVFEADGEDKTRIRSVEPWTGAAIRVGPVARFIEHRATAIGEQQLRGFARSFTAE